MPTTTTTAPQSLGNKTLISDELWERLVNRILQNEAGVTRNLAERIMDQALGFLKLCARMPGNYSPSALVDIGWHTFILYTQEYQKFCDRVAGRFIHHHPNDDKDVDYGGGSTTHTVDAMKQLGIPVDEELWPSAGRCKPICKPENLCSV